MKIKVAEASGAALDWLVAKAKGIKVGIGNSGRIYAFNAGTPVEYMPSANPAQGWPVLDGEDMCFLSKQFLGDPERAHMAYYSGAILEQSCWGSTRLIAGLREWARRNLGEEVDVPDALCEG